MRHCGQSARAAGAFAVDQRGDSPGLILNQIEYMAGRKTSVSTVPASVPPISV